MQVSHSRIETFKKCPYQFKLHYIDELETFPTDDPANPLIVGTALHTGIEQNTETAIKEYYANYPVITDKHIEEAMKLEAVIKKCKEALPPLNNALFETEINTPEFKGFIDLLIPIDKSEITQDERCDICSKSEYCPDAYSGCKCQTNRYIEWYDMYDFKYSNNIENYMKSGQLHEYKYYFEKINIGKRIRNMYFLFAPKVSIRMKYKNKTNPRDETLEEFRRRLTAELQNKEATLKQVEYDTEKVKDFLRNAKECRTATSYPKQPSRLCDWCEFQKYCEQGEELEIMNLPENKRRTVAANDKKKIWLYGAPFSGKTYLANEFPDPLMLNTDGNVKFIDAPFIPIKDVVTVEGRITKRILAWEIFKETIEELEKKQNDFKTIVVDLLEDTYEHCRLYMYNQLGITHESDDSFRAWDKVRIEFLSTIKRLMNLDYENIILISHEDTSKDLTKKSGDKISAIKPNIQDKAALKIAGMVDLVARVIDDEGSRTISFKTNEVIFGGGRLSLKVNEIPCEYEELVKVYELANAGKTSANVHESTKDAAKEEPKQKPETADAPPKEAETPELPKRKSRSEKTEKAATPLKDDIELTNGEKTIQLRSGIDTVEYMNELVGEGYKIAEEPKTEESGSNETKTEENAEVKTNDGNNGEAPKRRRRRTE